MYSIDEVKPAIEKIHITYLFKNFDLQFDFNLELNGFRPDFFAEKNLIFELKTRTYPRKNEKNKGKNHYHWWSLDPMQIKKYETIKKENKAELFWIFLLGHTPKEITKLNKISEKSILYREIYLVPWSAKNLVQPSQKALIHLSLPTLQEEYDFSKHVMKKGELNIELGIEQVVNKIFNI